MLLRFFAVRGSTMLGYDDKRNFYRMMINSPCSVTLADDPTKASMSAVCKDISATGMSVEMGEVLLELGTLLEISIESNSDQIPSLNAKAKVVRCDSIDDGAYLVGVEISEMN